MAKAGFVKEILETKSSPVRIGFVPLVDCAPLVVAQELGMFDEIGLRVELIREPGWASIRDKIVHQELEAAHALVGLCFAVSWGLGVLKRPCLTGFLFNSHGDSIVLSRNLLSGDGEMSATKKKLKFAVPHQFSTHHFLLRQWLKPYFAKEGKDFEVIFLPPGLMVQSLEEGHIDGFCVGEPYGSIAVERNIGGVVKESADLSPLHPEKALLVTQKYAEQNHEEHIKLISCLIKAAEFCDSPDGRERLPEILGQSCYLNQDPKIIKQSLSADSTIMKSEDFHLFSRFGINEPTTERANWIVNQMRLSNLIPDSFAKKDIRMEEIFRRDIYREAAAL